jgi:hypothetical protein
VDVDGDDVGTASGRLDCEGATYPGGGSGDHYTGPGRELH